MIRPWRTKAYKRDVDRTLIRENLKLTTQQRAEKMIAALAFAEEIRRVQQGQPVTDFRRLLEALTHQGVELIVIGGFAAMAHGSAHVTVDLDIVYRRTPENMSRLAAALAPLQPYLRGAPPGLPFRFDVETIKRRALWACRVRFVDLEALIHLKRAAGRPKDLERIAELEAIVQERNSKPD